MTDKEEHEKAMEEFFTNGGKIQYGSYRESGRIEGAVPTNPWGAKKAGRPPASDKSKSEDQDDEI
jgi:hypothetical protein